MSEDWFDSWSADHPVRWEPRGGTEPIRYLSVRDALDRLCRHWGDDNREWLEERLNQGVTAQTPFAYYEKEVQSDV